jgi:hypothetical protein
MRSKLAVHLREPSVLFGAHTSERRPFTTVNPSQAQFPHGQVRTIRPPASTVKPQRGLIFELSRLVANGRAVVAHIRRTVAPPCSLVAHLTRPMPRSFTNLPQVRVHVRPAEAIVRDDAAAATTVALL